MSETILKQTVFEDSLENEQTFNELISEINKRPHVIKRKAAFEANEKELLSRVPNKEFISKWVEALRVGKYPQQKGHYLRSDKRFTVLGVLCDVSKDFTGGKWFGSWFIPKDEYLRQSYAQSNIGLPSFALKKLGLTSDFLGSDFINDGSELIFKNDTHNFTELAEIIEKKYLK